MGTIYRGMTVLNDDIKNHIDSDSIYRGCYELKDVIFRMRSVSKSIIENSSLLDKNNLYMDDKDFAEAVRKCGNDVNVNADRLEALADRVLEALEMAANSFPKSSDTEVKNENIESNDSNTDKYDLDDIVIMRGDNNGFK